MVFLALPGYNIPYYIPLFLSSNLGRKGIPEAPAFHMANDSNHGPQHTEGSWGDVCFVETQANCQAGKIPDRITDHLTQNNFKSARNQRHGVFRLAAGWRRRGAGREGFREVRRARMGAPAFLLPTGVGRAEPHGTVMGNVH